MEASLYSPHSSILDLNKVNLSQETHCPLCHNSLDNNTKKKSDQQTKDFIYEMTLEDVLSCSCGCKDNDGNCIAQARYGDVGKLRKEFWGSRVDDLITAKVRGEKLDQLLRQFYDAPEKKFKYKVGDVSVCERGFFILLGLMTKSNLKPGAQLKRVMNNIKGNIPAPLKDDAEAKKLKRDKDPRSRCTHHAVIYNSVNKHLLSVLTIHLPTFS